MNAELLPLALALLVVATLTAAGMAVRSVGRIWLRHWAERRLRGAAVAVQYLERPHRLLIASGTGVALTLVMSGILLAARHGHSSGELLFAIVSFAITVLVLGQALPRAVARRWARPLLPPLLRVLRVVELVAAPVILVGRLAAAPFARQLRGDGQEETRDVIHDLLREGELEGVGERDEIRIITEVVEFGDKRVANAMTARGQIFALDAALPTEALARAIVDAGYSRVPIIEGSLDRVVGFVHAFDVLQIDEGRPPLRPVAEASPTTPCSELLFRMLRARRLLAIVRDDAQRTVGLVTLEDLLEELVGEIRDEHDEPHPAHPPAGAP